MNTEARKKLLYKYKLDSGDFYMMEDKIIIRRTGMDKLEKLNPINLAIESISTVPYGEACCTTILGSANLKDTYKIRSVASANPDNCKFPHYAEMALKRLRHRLLLMLLDMYEHSIFSEEESDRFAPAVKDFKNVVAEIQKMKVETPH